MRKRLFVLIMGASLALISVAPAAAQAATSTTASCNATVLGQSVSFSLTLATALPVGATFNANVMGLTANCTVS